MSETVFDNFVKVMGAGYVFEKAFKVNFLFMSVYFVFFVCCFGKVRKNGLRLPLYGGIEVCVCVCVCVSVCVRVNSFHFVHVVDGFTGDMCFFVSLFVFLVLRVIFVLFLLLDFVLWFYGCHLFYCFNVFVSVTCFN